jgi:isopentenyl phosphate kinase
VSGATAGSSRGAARPLLLVKLGGSLITDKARPETARPAVLARLAGELAAGLPALRRRGWGVVVGHGSGSFGHVAAAEHRVAAGLDGDPAQLAGVAHTQSRAAALHHLVASALRSAGLPAWSFAPSSALVAAAGEPAHLAAEPLALALAAGLLPVTYGDVVTDRRQGVAIASTETVFRALAAALPEHGWRVREALWLGVTPGVLDDDGRAVAEIRRGDAAAAHAGAAAGTDVTGGMAHRLDTALALADLGIESWILDGTAEGTLHRALTGPSRSGTRVAPPGTD